MSSYAELHCRSNFSFLRGASHPEQLVEVAIQRGLSALALTDRNGFYGVVRFAQAARALGLPTLFGAELDCANQADAQIVVIADGPSGYARLARAITLGQLAGSKSAPVFTTANVADVVANSCWVLTGARTGIIAQALELHGPDVAQRKLQQLISEFGRDRVLVELWDHGDPLDSVRNDALVQIAMRNDVQCIATNDVSYGSLRDYRLAVALVAVRQRASLDDIDHHLPPAPSAYIRSGAEQLRRFARYPGVVELTVEIAKQSAFDLSLVAPKLPPFVCPNELNEISYLRLLVEQGATHRYGSRPTTQLEDLSLRSKAWQVIDHELEVIEQLDFAGYFLVVWDIVQFCQRSNIFCQGRGSAANSAVCFALDITKADAVSLGLLFERFLSTERDGPPDIDIDIESGRREEVIQYVFNRYDRHHAAQVANVITYRKRSAIRDMSRALGLTAGQEVSAQVKELAEQVSDSPRHLGVHSGGMVICDRPIIEVCPVEWARMKDRSVLQWDKDDCAAIGLVKFDLLGLGMLSALHNAVDLIAEFRGVKIDLATIPQQDEIYAMLCRADTVGVFQVESRAQMATLPRLRPRRFYDLVVEVALIRPGPIQGGSVHPYIRRRNGQEPVTYLHPLLENSLGKTLGVPLFQEQLMQMAIDVAGFSATQADELRQAMGSKRSQLRMERLRQRLYDGMARNQIVGKVADQIFEKMQAFANFGFPESHSVSFAYLVYSSAFIKYHEPAAFYTALLNAQPMGFWSPHSLMRDAVRHGVVVRTPDLNASKSGATLEPCAESTSGFAVRLGITSVRGIGQELALAIEAARPFVNMEDLVRRVPQLNLAQVENLATAGVYTQSFGISRRDALWSAGAIIHSRPDRLAGITTGSQSPQLPGMQPIEEAICDLWATGISPDGHPTQFVREQLDKLGVVTAIQLPNIANGSRIFVGGVVTHRQRPPTARGVTFLSLEDETGLINVIVSQGCWKRFHSIAVGSSALVVRGRAESAQGVVNIIAEHLAELKIQVEHADGLGRVLLSRNFR